MNKSELINRLLSQYSNQLKGLTIGLVGGLGSGKTHFVKELLGQISDQLMEQVTSPTYNICNIYQNGHLTVHHFDLYRIDNEEDLYDTSIWDSVCDETVLTFVEWIDLFPGLCSKTPMIIKIALDETGFRDYTILLHNDSN